MKKAKRISTCLLLIATLSFTVLTPVSVLADTPQEGTSAPQTPPKPPPPPPDKSWVEKLMDILGL